MEPNIKLIVLINDLSFFYSHRLIVFETLKLKGFKVIVGYGESGGADPNLLKIKGIDCKLIPMERGKISILKDLKTLFHIWRFFKKEKPDVAHLVTVKPYLYGGIISRLTGVPNLISAVSGLGTLFIHKDLKSKFLRFLLFFFYKFAFNHPNQKVILQNEEDAKVLINWKILNDKKVRLLKGSGVNLELFTKLDEPEGVPTVCFSARLLRDKGIYEFINAAKIIKERGIKAKFYLAGDLDSKNPSSLSQEELDYLTTKDYIKIIGYQKDIPELFSKSNIICLPSYREGLPKTLIEAAAAARAVVTTDVPGCRDSIIPNETGLLVPQKDSKKLADAIEWLIKNPKDRVSMGKAGRKLAEREFYIEKIIQGHLDIYKDLLGNYSK